MTPNLNDSLILIVDDTDAARYAKTRILTHAGFKVIEAANGTEALQRAKAKNPDLVLLDVKLPDINGLEVCRKLKEDPSTRMILVLQTSASYVASADKIRALEYGADNYLFEPIEPEELVANVKALLRLGRVERELRDVDRRKDEFLAVLAHELRNPLAPIRNAVELLHHLDPCVPEKQANARQTIIRQTDHLVRLVDDLLDVSRISQGKITLREERIELKAIIDAAIETATPMIQRRQHTLRVELPEHEVWLTGDSVRLSQIICNLLLNGAKFTQPGGELAVVAKRLDDNILIKVQDNGIGIPADSMLSIFNLFAQVERASDRTLDGLGIGLALVKTLVELHGGTVTAVSSGLGQGSTFEIRLPIISSDQAQPSQQAAASESDGGGRRRVLVVDDNVDAADIVCSLLELDGHNVQKSYNGAGAIESARDFQPEVVFLDIDLPDMSGLKVAAQLRKMPAMQCAVIVALTGFGQEKDRDSVLAAGFDHHLTKPVSFDTLVLTVRNPPPERA
jgi:signal transduction histidine kinase